MKPRISGLYGIVALLAGTALACHNDPTASGVGTPFAVVLDFSALTLDQGSTAQVVARIVDSRFTPLTGDITFASCNAATTVALDPTFVPEPPTAKRATISAVGASAGCVVASAGGAKPDSVSIVVLPTSFGGAVSATTPAGGSTITIASTASLKFDPATASVTFGGGHVAPIVSATADLLTVLVPFSDAGPLSISGIDVTYVPGLTVTLETTASVTQTGDAWAASNNWQTAPDITSLLPGAGSTALFQSTTTGVDNSAVCPEAALGFGSSGPCMMFKFTLAAPALVKFTTSWEGTAAAPDIDIYVCADSAVANFGTDCFEDGGLGATGSLPQSTGPNNTLAAGTHWFVIEVYGGGTSRNITTTIEQ